MPENTRMARRISVRVTLDRCSDHNRVGETVAEKLHCKVRGNSRHAALGQDCQTKLETWLSG